MPILVKPFLFLIAFGPLAVLFASAIGLACWLLIVCVRAISLASFTWLQVIARPAGPVLTINRRHQRRELTAARLAQSGQHEFR